MVDAGSERISPFPGLTALTHDALIEAIAQKIKGSSEVPKSRRELDEKDQADRIEIGTIKRALRRNGLVNPDQVPCLLPPIVALFVSCPDAASFEYQFLLLIKDDQISLSEEAQRVLTTRLGHQREDTTGFLAVLQDPRFTLIRSVILELLSQDSK